MPLHNPKRSVVRLVFRVLVASLLVVGILPAVAGAEPVPDLGSPGAKDALRDSSAQTAADAFGVLAAPSWLPDADTNADIDNADPLSLPTQNGAINRTTDLADCYSVYLDQWDVLGLTLTFPSNTWCHAEVYAPGTGSIWGDNADLEYLSTPQSATTERTQIVAREAGTYYVLVWIDLDDYYYGSASYSLTGSIVDMMATDADVEIPGTAAGTPDGTKAGTLNWTNDVSDVYSFAMSEEEELELTLTGPAVNMYGYGGFEMFVYQAGTTSCWEDTATFAVYVENDDGSSEAVTYHIPPGGGGTVYVEINTEITTGSYTLTYDTGQPAVSRVAGSDRYRTSYAASKSSFMGSGAVVIATGEGFADALSASGLAGALDAPLLLAPKLTRTSAVWDFLYEMWRIDPADVYIVGGTSAVSGELDDLIADFGLPVPTRVWGSDRYETARDVADEIVSINGPVSSAFVVRGDDFADALAVSPFSFSNGVPILLTKPGYLKSQTQSFLDVNNVNDVVVAGGEGAVSDDVVSALEALNGGACTVERYSGSNRYATAADVAAGCIDDRGWGSWDFIGVATGTNFPDALSGSTACGKRGAALLLTKTTLLSSQTSTVISDNAGSVDQVMIFGGESAVTDTVKSDIAGLLK